MIATALDKIPMPPVAKLLGWRLADARPQDGWIRMTFDGKQDFCNPAGFIQGGMLSAMILAIFWIPLFYVVVCSLFEKKRPEPARENEKEALQ